MLRIWGRPFLTAGCRVICTIYVPPEPGRAGDKRLVFGYSMKNWLEGWIWNGWPDVGEPVRTTSYDPRGLVFSALGFLEELLEANCVVSYRAGSIVTVTQFLRVDRRLDLRGTCVYEAAFVLNARMWS